MAVLTIILGIFLAIGGVVCLFTPLVTTYGMMYFIMVLMFVSGIMGIIRNIYFRTYGLDFIFSVITVILGCFLVFDITASFVAEIVILYIIAAWFVVRGIVSLADAFTLKKVTDSAAWVGLLIIAIILVLIGIYSFFHPMVLAVSMGILISVYFIAAGVDMIVVGISLAQKK